MRNLKNQKTKAPFLELAWLATSALFVCLTLACSQATATAPDLGATVDAAVAATVEAQGAAPSLAPTKSNLGQAIPTQMLTAAPIPTSTPTVMPVPTLTPISTPTSTLIATPYPTDRLTPTPYATPDQAPETPTIDLQSMLIEAAATFEAGNAATLSAPAPILAPPSTPVPTATPTPTPAPEPFDIKIANCHAEDTGGHEFVGSEGPYSHEQWGVREWYRTSWSGEYPKADKIRCLTSVYDSIEEARWSLVYSTAIQRGEWVQAGLLEHRQITGIIIGEDSLAFEIETGRGTLPEYVSANILIRWGNVVIHLEAISNIGWSAPSARGAAYRAFFGSVWNPLIELAHLTHARLLAELDRVSR